MPNSSNKCPHEIDAHNRCPHEAQRNRFQSSTASVIHLKCSQAKTVQRVVHYHVYTKHPGINMNPSDEELGNEVWMEVEHFFFEANLSREEYKTVGFSCCTHNLVASTFGSNFLQMMCMHIGIPVMSANVHIMQATTGQCNDCTIAYHNFYMCSHDTIPGKLVCTCKCQARACNLLRINGD